MTIKQLWNQTGDGNGADDARDAYENAQAAQEAPDLCPRCSSPHVRRVTHWEEPDLVCDDCGYGT